MAAAADRIWLSPLVRATLTSQLASLSPWKWLNAVTFSLFGTLAERMLSPSHDLSDSLRRVTPREGGSNTLVTRAAWLSPDLQRLPYPVQCLESRQEVKRNAQISVLLINHFDFQKRKRRLESSNICLVFAPQHSDIRCALSCSSLDCQFVSFCRFPRVDCATKPQF